jgi:hypothetical protein
MFSPKLNDDDYAQLEHYKLPLVSPIYGMFWTRVHLAWDTILQMLTTSDTKVVYLINNLLPEPIKDKIEIEITYNTINKQEVNGAQNVCEFYISPLFSKNNIAIMKALYHASSILDSLVPRINYIVNCFRAYHEKDDLLESLQHESGYVVNYDDFAYQSHIQLVQNDNLQFTTKLNIIVSVNDDTAQHVLTKKEIQFIEEQTGRQSSRTTWLPENNNGISLFLLNILGEANMMNYINSIEFLPKSEVEKLEKTEEGTQFRELSDLRNDMQLLLKQQNVKLCCYCSKTSIQSVLLQCSKCKSVHYCSVVCQRANWKLHKTICKKK